MKKTLLALVCLALTLSFCSCSGEKTDPTTTAPPEPTAAPQSAGYVLPADFEQIILPDSGDISTEKMSFEYDSMGRILSCSYDYGSGAVLISYLYTENSVGVTAFLGATKLAESAFAHDGTFDAGNGYTVHEGYYFFGYSF
ncbi:MAG: hypothetical protein K6C36_06825 [Clostridia bacterium]|nr:hypothetical protein [Clostridia bacterium]